MFAISYGTNWLTMNMNNLTTSPIATDVPVMICVVWYTLICDVYIRKFCAHCVLACMHQLVMIVSFACAHTHASTPCNAHCLLLNEDRRLINR